MRYQTNSAAQVYLLREKNGRTQVLLHQRGSGTNGTGLWDASAAGHVDEGESLTMCAVRETKEEIGVDINAADIVFTTIIHTRPWDLQVPYYDGHFFIYKFKGKPSICEGEKCSCLKWFDISKLPSGMFGDRREAIQNFLDKRCYSELGWE